MVINEIFFFCYNWSYNQGMFIKKIWKKKEKKEETRKIDLYWKDITGWWLTRNTIATIIWKNSFARIGRRRRRKKTLKFCGVVYGVMCDCGVLPNTTMRICFFTNTKKMKFLF